MYFTLEEGTKRRFNHFYASWHLGLGAQTTGLQGESAIKDSFTTIKR